MAKYDEASCLMALRRKGIAFKGNQINLIAATELGNKSFGKLDYLVNYCGYVVVNSSPERGHCTYAASGKGIYPYNPFQNSSRKLKRAIRKLADRTANYASQTSNRCSGHVFTRPGSMQM